MYIKAFLCFLSSFLCPFYIYMKSFVFCYFLHKNLHSYICTFSYAYINIFVMIIFIVIFSFMLFYAKLKYCLLNTMFLVHLHITLDFFLFVCLFVVAFCYFYSVELIFSIEMKKQKNMLNKTIAKTKD